MNYFTTKDIIINVIDKDIKILIACEESQEVCKAFRKKGFIAFSCDLLECSGGHPEWHIQQDVLTLINGNCSFRTVNGFYYKIIGQWDLIIAHPPCTYMSKAGARWMYPTAGIISEERFKLAMEAKDFFFKIFYAKCDLIAIENPVPLKVIELPEPTCFIQPYHHGEPYSKKTCLWLKNLPIILPTKILTNYKPFLPSNTGGVHRGQKYFKGFAKNSKEASKTFKGIAEAMADQWGNYLLNYKQKGLNNGVFY